MGLSLSKVFKSTGKSLPGALSGFIAGGGPTPMGFGMAAMGALSRKALPSPVAAGIPSIQSVTGVAPFFAAPVVQRNGGIGVTEVVPVAAGAGALMISRSVVSAVMKLASAFGIALTAVNFRGVAMRLWRAVTAFSRRHPSISILAFLTSLGLLADEAAEFLFWGQQRVRRRRGRGISARDIRTCRRTMRRMAAFQRDMFRAAPRRRGARRGDGTIIAQN